MDATMTINGGLNMDQIKIGSFLKELRKEKGLTQEQLAEQFNVSNRSVSRWETGSTLPDISILIELAEFYNVDISDLLNGERKGESSDKNLKETLEMVADYTKAEKEKLTKELIWMTISSATFFGILGIIIVFQLTRLHNAFVTFSAFCATVGFSYSVMSIIKLMQINGKVNKKGYKKIVTGLIIAGCVIFVFSILVILWDIGVIFG